MVALEQWQSVFNSNRRWIVHFFFWGFVLLLYTLFFGRGAHSFLYTLFFVGLLMPVTIGSTYFLNYFLVPNYLLQERYFSFIVYFIYTLIAVLFMEMWLVVLTFIVMAEANVKDMSPDSINFPFLIAALLMVVFLGVALKMLSRWQQSKNEYQQLMRDKLEAELRFLKTQLNPHFLFNTLNNLYFLSLEKSDQAPKAILALSEMLDYVLHDGKSILIPLSQEIKQLKNYISLERMRYEGRIDIDIKTEGDMQTPKIVPMMLITLVENSFKHGAMKTADNAWIKIEITNVKESIQIKVQNSWKKIAMGSGIGLANVKDQLRILFPDRHSFLVDDSSEEFKVTLTIEHS